MHMPSIPRVDGLDVAGVAVAAVDAVRAAVSPVAVAAATVGERAVGVVLDPLRLDLSDLTWDEDECLG